MPLRPAPTDRSPDAHCEFGVVVLDKPAGPTSHQVSDWVGSILGIDRTGHLGTLDPKVTGCLPVLLGTATRLTAVLTGGDKAYVALLELHDDPPTNWQSKVSTFEGPLYQRPPRKSAVARRLRIRSVHDLEILEHDGRRILLKVRCGAGTYIRKLCHDLGMILGTGGHMAALRRIESTPFDDTELVTLHDLTDGVGFWEDEDDDAAFEAVVRPAEDALAHLPWITITDNTAEAVACGAPVYAPGIVEIAPELAERDEATPVVVCATSDGSAVCIGRVVGDLDADTGEVISLDRVLV